MYLTKEQFEEAVEGLYGTYWNKHRPVWYEDQWGEEEEIDRAWKLYNKARNTQLSMLLLGDQTIRNPDDNHGAGLLRNFGTTAAYPVQDFKGRTFPGKAASSRRGSILNEEDWWTLPNDAWVLGGVHSLTRFYLASPTLPADDLLWDKNKKRPRVLGRELIGLIHFGYARVIHQAAGDHGRPLQITFDPPVNEAKATGATFAEYLSAIKTFKRASDIKAKLNGVTRNIPPTPPKP
jgi:hypothetical protein